MNYIERRQTSVSSRIIPVQPFDYVVFGATGDLTKRKLIPALYHRFLDGQFDEKSRIIGVSRTKLTDEEFQKAARDSMEEAREVFERIKDQENMAWTLYYIARLEEKSGNHLNAAIALDKGMDLWLAAEMAKNAEYVWMAETRRSLIE